MPDEDPIPPSPPAPVTLRGLVDRIIAEIILQRGEADTALGVVTEADLRHKYYSLHGSDTPGGSASLSRQELDRLIGLLSKTDRKTEYEDLWRRARAYRETALSGETPSFYHMDLFKPARGYGWVTNGMALLEGYGVTFEPPTLANINVQLDQAVRRVRAERGDIAAMDGAYSLLQVQGLYGSGGALKDQRLLRLMLLYEIADFAAQIGAVPHLRFLIREIETELAAQPTGSDVERTARRMKFYCQAQILCVAPPKRPAASYYRALRTHTDEAVGAFDGTKVSAELAQHLSPLVAGWAGAHFQRVAASLSASPTQAEFDRLLDDHDAVAGALGARFPKQFSFALFGEAKRREIFAADPYIAELLALRTLLPLDHDDGFRRGANGLYPLDPRLDTAEAILDEGLRSPMFGDKTHEAIKVEMLQWKLVLMLSRHARRWTPSARLAYLQVKLQVRALMEPLGMLKALQRIEAFHEVNASFRL